MLMKTLVAARGCVVAWTLFCMVCWPPYVHAHSNIGQAKYDMFTLEKALLAYKVRYGVWPDSLQALAERHPDGGAALIKESMLLDPWNRPYQFDVTQVHPETGAFLVWSDGPEPGQPGSRITNWPMPDHTTFWDVVGNPAVWLPVV